jgi:hypothetical protein
MAEVFMESGGMDCGGMDGCGMESGGLDFVETSFGSEGAAGGASKFVSPQDKEKYWQKWSQAGSRNPIFPLILGFFLFVIAISAPYVLDYIQEQKLAQQEAEQSAAQVQAAEVAGNGNLNMPQAGGVPYALTNSGGIDANRQMFHTRLYGNQSPSGQYPQAQGYPQTQGYPQAQGYPQTQGYPQAQGYPHTAGVPIEYGTPPMQGVPQTRYRVYVNR